MGRRARAVLHGPRGRRSGRRHARPRRRAPRLRQRLPASRPRGRLGLRRARVAPVPLPRVDVRPRRLAARRASFRPRAGLRPRATGACGPCGSHVGSARLRQSRPDDGVELEDVLGDLPQVVLDRGLDATTLAYRGRSRDWVVDANWKVVVENYLECYHCPVAHKSFSRLIDVDPDAYALSTSRWSSSQLGSVPRRVEDGDTSGLPVSPGGLDARATSTTSGRTGRSTSFPGAAHLRVLVFEPEGPERTRTYADGFWDPDTPDEVVDEITEFGAVVGEEDRDLVESVQRGLALGSDRARPAAPRQRAPAPALPAPRRRRARRRAPGSRGYNCPPRRGSRVAKGGGL